MKRLIGLFFMTGIFASAMALSMFSKVFDKTYDISKDSNLGKHACQVCHVGPKGGKVLNNYGKDVQAAMKKMGVKKVSPEVLKAVEGLDSSKTGVKNIVLIKKDKFPGGN